MLHIDAVLNRNDAIGFNAHLVYQHRPIEFTDGNNSVVNVEIAALILPPPPGFQQSRYALKTLHAGCHPAQTNGLQIVGSQYHAGRKPALVDQDAKWIQLGAHKQEVISIVSKFRLDKFNKVASCDLLAYTRVSGKSRSDNG